MYEKFVVQMKDMVRNEINKVHTALPGEITEIDAESGFCTVQPKGQLHISGRVEKVLDFPPIAEVPMLFPYSKTAGAEIAFPVKAGDDCLIIFSEQALEYWLGTGLQNSALKHSLSNAICIPGLMKELPDGMREAIETDSVIIRKGESKIVVSDEGITAQRGDIGISISDDGAVVQNGESKITLTDDGIAARKGDVEIAISDGGAIAIKHEEDETLDGEIAISGDDVIVRKGESKIALASDEIHISGNITVDGDLTVNGKISGDEI